jgi:hypothetical protein
MIGVYAVTYVLTAGVIVAFGILSASGMLLLTPSVLFVVSAFVFGGVVEGEVFKQEILEGLHDLTLLGKRGYQHLIVDALARHLKNQPPAQGFLHEYQQLQRYLEGLCGKKLTDHQKKQKAAAQKRLRHMQEYFARQVLQDSGNISEPYDGDEELRDAIQSVHQQLPIMRAKMNTLRLALPFSLLCGVGFGFATAAALPAALAAISVSLSFMVWPLAVMAAIGYTFLIFHTAKDLLFSDGFRKWKERIKKWFTPGPEGVTAGFVLKAAGVALIAVATVALCVMGTLATAGTWWLAVKHGAKLIPFLKNAANIVRTILTPIAAIGNFIFSLYNSFESIHVVQKAIASSQPIQSIKTQWQDLKNRENVGQIINPFRIVSKVIQKCADAVMLLGHVLASGTARDQFMNVSPTLLAVTTAGSELTQDVTFFFEEGKKTMIQKAVTFLISPLLCLSALWQAAASCANSPEHVVSLKQAFKDAFGMIDKQPYTGDEMPVQSGAWRQAEIFRRFDKEEKRLQSTIIRHDLACEKINVLREVKEQLLSREDALELSEQQRQALSQHRIFQSKKPTSSETFLSKYYTADDNQIDHHNPNKI